MSVPDGWQAVIGLEIHVQLSTRSKMFCRCPNEPGGEPNTRICPVCTAQPGVLPVANREAVERTIKVGLALESEIAPHSTFHRKNYFYPDSPKAYQISQYDEPLCSGGRLAVPTADGDDVIGFERVHLEEDAAKTVHEGGGGGRLAGSHGAVVDFNRCGTPLMEMVTRPDLRTPEQASRFAAFLRETIVALGVSECDMEKGSLRVDANVSLRRPGETELSTKTELKNVNSFSYLERGITRELRRQAELYEAGQEVVTETLHYDPGSDELTVLRSKELAHDYRYFPEPDLVPIVPSDELIEGLRAALPELPAARVRRFEADYALPLAQALDLGVGSELAAYFEEVAAACKDPRAAANWVLNEFSAHLNEARVGPAESPVRPAALAALIGLVADDTLGSSGAKQVFAALVAGESGGDPAAIVEARGLGQISDTGELAAVVAEIVAGHPAQAEQFRGGKENLMGFFVGQVMKATGGRAEPQIAQQLLREELARG